MEEATSSSRTDRVLYYGGVTRIVPAPGREAPIEFRKTPEIIVGVSSLSQSVHIVSVGGSSEPVVLSVQSRRADRSIFFCSARSRKTVDGPGKPCEIRKNGQVVESLPSIVSQLRLRDFNSDRDLIVVEEPDDLESCYLALAPLLAELAEEGYDVTADYTGGTKTMSVALASAALDYGAQLVLTSGPRDNLIKVTRGSLTESAPTTSIQIERLLSKTLPRLLSSYDYAAANQELNATLQSANVAREQRTVIKRLANWIRGLDAWDRFDHLAAIELLQLSVRYPVVRDQFRFLQNVAASRSALDETFEFQSRTKNLHGYEILEDLLLNAARRASQARYDDAVGRLYRALELMAQLRLSSRYSIQTGAIRQEQVPAEFVSQLDFEEGVAKAGLFKSYDLLAALPDDPLGALFQDTRGRILNALQARNSSILAHGFTPIDQGSYHEFSETVETFLTEGLNQVLKGGHTPAAQLPDHIPPELLSRA